MEKKTVKDDGLFDKPIFGEWILPSLSFGLVHFHF